MEVNFNNLRKRACLVYDELATNLNNALQKHEKEYFNADSLEIDVYDIEHQMDELRQLLIGMLCCYTEDGQIKDMYDETYPNDGEMVSFNPKRWSSFNNV